MLNKDSHSHKILILDYGSQTTQLIARRVREAGVYCELLPGNVAEEEIRDFKPNGIILSGGYDTVTTADSINVPDIVFEMNCPVLGICYGMQAMAQQLGGKVSGSHKPEFGYAKVKVESADSLLENIDDHIDADGTYIDVWMNHSDFVTELPDGFQAICSTGSSPYAGMANFEKQFFGLQFHPEVTHTKQGERILSRFVKDICGCEVNWTFDNIIAEQVEKVREQVGDEKVLVGLSGGVDSAVVAALLYKAIGDQVTCVLVDTGLLRLGEADQVINVFNNHFGLDVVCVDAKDTFLTALKGESDPEKKRKIIGEQFIRVFENESKKLNDIKWLAQGTIYPDVIESAKTKTGGGHVIKSHHNVGGLPEKMDLKLIEPLRELFKDEVRKLGVELGLPTDLVYRHPFPGPGLGVRIPGEIKPEYIEILQKADAIFIEELRAADLYDKVSQAFAVFLPIKSVGVKGDARHYGYVIGLRAVETTDFMTAHWAHLPYDFLGKMSNRIVNEIQEVSRVVYDISGKPPATIEWE